VIAILANRTFRRLFTAQVVALIGTGLLTVALGLLAYDLAGSRAGAVLGTALAIKMAAYVLVAPVISAVAHRIPHRVLLVGSDVVRGAVAGLLPFVADTWQIYLLIFVLQAASATFTPAFQALIPAVLVDEGDYTRGLSLSRLAYDLESLLSPMLAAALLVVLAYDDLFVGTVIGFALSAVLVLTTAVPSTESDEVPETLWQRVTLGARVMLGRPVLRALLALNLVVASATALVIVNTVVYVNDILHASGSALAVLLACYGGGSMVVALAVPRLLTAVTDRALMLVGAACVPPILAATTVLLLAQPEPSVGWVAFAVAWLLLGAATSLISTPSARLVRYEAAPATRSAVFTAQFSLSHACFFLTYPLAGWAGAAIGQPTAAAALTALAALAAGTGWRLWPTDRASVTAPPPLAATAR
jgi:hypothetical protein